MRGDDGDWGVGMDGYTVTRDDSPASDWSAYDAETDQLIKAAKLSDTMKAGLISWWEISRRNASQLTMVPVKGTTLAAYEARKLVSRNERTGLWRLTASNAGNGARFAARLTDLDSAQGAAAALASLASARADVEAYDAAQAAQARSDAQEAAQEAAQPVAGVTTASPWKASNGKRSKVSGGKRGWRK